MQAIRVKFLGPTNVRGSRYKATCAAGSVTLGSDHALNPSDNAARAAGALCVKLGWDDVTTFERLMGGCLSDGSFVFVILSRSTDHYTMTGEPIPTP